MLISQNKLAELTQKDRKTIRRLLDRMPSQPGPHRAQLYDSARALEQIYLGAGDGAFITTAEAFRQLTIARKRQIEIDVDIKRRTRIPIEDCERVFDEILAVMRAIIKASLSVEAANEVFDSMRKAADFLQQKYAEVDPNKVE